MKDKKNTSVYALVDSLFNEIRYIGITINTKIRLQDHLKPSKLKENFRKSNWIKKILSEGGEIKLIVIEKDLTWEEACERERYYISILPNLTNLTLGGDGCLGRILSEELKFKVGSANRGKNVSDLYGDKISIGLKKAYSEGKRTMSKEHQQKLISSSKKVCEKIILQFDKNEKFICEYNSATSAATALDCAITTICDCANSRTKTALGFKWKYK